MKPTQFRCPHCRTLLAKNAQMQVLGEVKSFIAFGSPTAACPSCGGEIDKKAIVEGKYDVKGPGLISMIFWFAVAVIVIYYCHQC